MAEIIDIIIVSPDDVREPDTDYKWFAYVRDTGNIVAVIKNNGDFKVLDEYAPMFNEENGALKCRSSKWIGTDDTYRGIYFSSLSGASKIEIAATAKGVKFKI